MASNGNQAVGGADMVGLTAQSAARRGNNVMNCP